MDFLLPLDDEDEVDEVDEEDLLLFLFLVLLVEGLGESGGDALTSLAVSAPPALCLPAWPAVATIGAEDCRCGGRAARDRTALHADGGYCGGGGGCS